MFATFWKLDPRACKCPSCGTDTRSIWIVSPQDRLVTACTADCAVKAAIAKRTRAAGPSESSLRASDAKV